MPESDTVKIWTLICGVITTLMVPVAGGIVTYFVWKMTDGQRTASAERAAEAKAAAVKADEVSTAAAVSAKDVADLVAIQSLATVQVKKDLANSNVVTAAKLEEIGDTTHATHTLVNSQKGVLLESLAAAYGRLAESGSPADIEAAAAAQKAVREHQAKQDVVDDRSEQKGATVIVVAAPNAP
jgi:hypothetical protein